jgi:hypothetical protein
MLRGGPVRIPILIAAAVACGDSDSTATGEGDAGFDAIVQDARDTGEDDAPDAAGAGIPPGTRACGPAQVGGC